MSRSLGFEQQHYAGGGMWMEAQAQEGYSFQENSWCSDNSYHKRFPGMHMNQQLGGFGMDSELSMSNQQRAMLGGLQMNRFGGFDRNSDLSMSKQGKLGSMHMNTGSMQGHGGFGMDSELSMSKQQHGGGMLLNKLIGSAMDSDEFSMSKHRGKLGSMHMNKLVGSAMDSGHSMSKHHGKLGSMHMNKLVGSAMDSDHSMSKQHGRFGGRHGMCQEGMHNDHGYVNVHRGGRKSPFGGNNGSYHALSGGGGAKFGSGGHNEYYSDESECEEAYAEEHVGAVSSAKVEEMRYQHQNWGGNSCYMRPSDRNMNWWVAKGV